MNKYKQLTLGQRYEIEVLIKQGKKQSGIAISIGLDKSTVSREIERNSAGGKYSAEEAQRRCVYKQGHRSAYKLKGAMLGRIEDGLKEGFSPEQIKGLADLEGVPMASHESIYLLVYKKQRKQQQQQQQQQQDSWWLNCLRSKQRKRQRRANEQQNRAALALKPVKEPKVSIEMRPGCINNKERIGDCEIDTIIGKGHKGAILTIVERISKHTTIVKLPNKTDEAVTEAFLKIAPSLPFDIFSLTSDNGTEFAGYNTIKELLDCDFFFAHPYSSWERGLNENTNGLIRQYIPKKSDFALYDDEYIASIENKLNNRPRKTLGFLTPIQFLSNFNGANLVALEY
jgi:IS30 family transposase